MTTSNETKTVRLTKAQIEDIIDEMTLNKSKTVTEIAKDYDVTYRTIYNHLMNHLREENGFDVYVRLSPEVTYSLAQDRFDVYQSLIGDAYSRGYKQGFDTALPQGLTTDEERLSKYSFFDAIKLVFKSRKYKN